MFSRKTLLVVGAGASSEVKLPVGEELANEIASLLRYKFDFGRLETGDPTFLDHLRRLLQDGGVVNDYLAIGRRMSEGIRNCASVDNYIDVYKDDERVAILGKAAIVYLILQAESTSLLSTKRGRSGEEGMIFEPLYKTWYAKFGRLLREQVSQSDLEKIFNNLTIICFNYDRCIEQFLAFWIKSIYSVELNQAHDLVDRLRILRPYGSVAAITGQNCVAFGFDKDRISLSPLVKNIKTYTERVEDAEILLSLRSAVNEAATVVFLGFAFHPQNLALLANDKPTTAKRIFASAYGFSKPDAENIQLRLAKLFHQTETVSRSKIIVRPDLTCSQLFDEYRLSLSA
ncbi:hypothetical protein [Hyphomicrobium sp. MC1]|uniref:hypothetical protein n=1 Tax=Hyphomicrobium sp. (strain MC1) TaxID=717785 RepID=UPI000213E1B4|nr:hypothetical protein [Hyphomicrobium sp. MC1]CCB65236.1 conserved protein of unknown function [Hyphomicrobium sp. MC1]